MKKLTYSFAAMALALAFTACGNKTEGPAEGADSTQTAEAEAPSNFCENDLFSVTGPEGWEIKKGSFGRISMEDVNSKETFKPKMYVGVDKNKTLKDKEEYYLTKTKGFKKGADVTIGNYTFTTFRNDDSKLYYCFHELEGGGLLEVETVYFEPESDIVKPVVESIKLK